MQPWEKTLTDQKIADVLTYFVRSGAILVDLLQPKALRPCAKNLPAVPSHSPSLT